MKLALAVAALALIAAPAPAQPSQWELNDQLPGVKEKSCSARLAGPQVDVTLILNNVGKPVLVFGHPDWHGLNGVANGKLSISGGPPLAIEAGMVDNIVLYLVEPALLPKLRLAKSLDLTLPFGKFHAATTGLGAALDWVVKCQRG